MFDRLSRWIFFVLSIELVVGGGGRLTAIGPVSLRMVLFALAMIVAAIYFFRGRRIPSDYLGLMSVFAAVLAIGVVVGFTNGASYANIWEDVKPLLYFFLLPFISYAIATTDTDKLHSIFKFGAVSMAIAFISIIILIHTGLIPFLEFYHLVIPTGEFFFRGEITFFYKGFFYLCIGLIFLIEEREEKWKILIVSLAVLLTVTRGLWISLLLTYGVCYMVLNRQNAKAFAGATATIVVAVLLIFFGGNLIGSVSKALDQARNSSLTAPHNPRLNLLGDRLHSDAERRKQIQEVLNRVTPLSAAIGHGFGNGVPVRPVHMEISYLEIFHKQGFLGLVCWALIFFWGIKKFWSARPNRSSIPFLLSFIFVFVQSVTNQFINNPIGLYLIMVCIVCFDRCSQKIPDEETEYLMTKS